MRKIEDIMKERRTYLQLTQQDLAEMSGISIATIKEIERGKGNPSLNTACKILEVLGMEIDFRLRNTYQAW